MKQLERWEYGNPQNVLERKQSGTCAGCKHGFRVVSPFDGDKGWMACDMKKAYGKRCKKYEAS